MATFTGKQFGKLQLAVHNAEVDLDTHDIKVLATTSTYTPDQDTHDYLNDVTNEVAVANGYARKTLASKTVTYTGATNKFAFDAADLQWTTATFTFRNLVVFDDNGGADSARVLIGYQAGDGDVTGGGGNLDFAWAAAGLLENTVS